MIKQNLSPVREFSSVALSDRYYHKWIQVNSTLRYDGYAPNNALDSSPMWVLKRTLQTGLEFEERYAVCLDGEINRYCTWLNKDKFFPPIPPTKPGK